MNRHRINVILLGNSNVGKSTFLKKVAPQYEFIGPTIGVDSCTIPMKIEHWPLGVCIWDTAGQEKFQAITNAYYRMAQGVILIFDVNNIESYYSLQHWIHAIRAKCPENVPVLIIANKIDLPWMIKRDEVIGFIKNLDNVSYTECCSIDLSNTCNTSLLILVQKIMQKYDNDLFVDDDLTSPASVFDGCTC